MQKYLKLSLFYITQFPVNFSLTKKNKLMVFDILVYLLFIRYVFNKFNGSSVKFNFIRCKRNIFVTTKAPYRYKLTRNQYLNLHYFYKLDIKFTLNTISYPGNTLLANEIINLLGTFEIVFLSIHYATLQNYYKVNFYKLFSECA